MNIKQLRELITIILEDSVDCFSMLDSHARMLYHSPAVERITGYTPAELLGKNAFDFIHPDDAENKRAQFEMLLSKVGHRTKAFVRWRKKSRGWAWLEVIGHNRLDNPMLKCITVNFRDYPQWEDAGGNGKKRSTTPG